MAESAQDNIKPVIVPFAHAELVAILEALPDPAFILTRSGRYAAYFGGADHRYYHDGSSLVGQTLSAVIVREKADWFLAQIEEALNSRVLHIVEYSLAGRDVKGLPVEGPDQPIWFEGRVQALNFLVDGEEAVIWVASNITRKNALELQLRTQSLTDALTGLLNRRALLEALDARYALLIREATSTAVLMFDIDHFKVVNDEGGHHDGDEALRAVAEACRGLLRKSDLSGRLGGDEFVILMPDTTIEQARIITERLSQRIARDLTRILDRPTTISGGLSELRPDDPTGQDVLRRVDESLYRAKREGRNRIFTC